MRLVWPSREFLPSYVMALERGWSPRSDGDRARIEEELAAISLTPMPSWPARWTFAWLAGRFRRLDTMTAPHPSRLTMTNPYEPPKAEVRAAQALASRGTELASHILFARLPDGRIIFRPWGRRGACYLLDERQRLVRARAQRVFRALGLVAIVVSNQFLSVGMALGVLLPVALGLQYLLFWCFARGLPRTEAPPEVEGSKTQRRELARQRMRERARLMGKGRLWAMLLGSLVFVAGSVLIAVGGGSIAAALGGLLFFGACAALFAWQLRQLSRRISCQTHT